MSDGPPAVLCRRVNISAPHSLPQQARQAAFSLSPNDETQHTCGESLTQVQATGTALFRQTRQTISNHTKLRAGS
jgi:hypothetical protein